MNVIEGCDDGIVGTSSQRCGGRDDRHSPVLDRNLQVAIGISWSSLLGSQ
jgi:hypothetical protein